MPDRSHGLAHDGELHWIQAPGRINAVVVDLEVLLDHAGTQCGRRDCCLIAGRVVGEADRAADLLKCQERAQVRLFDPQRILRDTMQ